MTRLVRFRPPMLLLFAAACGRGGAPPPQAVPVTVGAVRRQPVPFELDAVGTVEPMQTVAVQPQVTGQLLRIDFREGQEVVRGQVLFEIDPRPFRAAVQQAAAVLSRDSATAANAGLDESRYADLIKRQYITAQQYDQARTAAATARATLAADQAALEQDRLNLQYATIRAPIAGRTGSLQVREGNLVRANTSTLVTINQIRPILVRFAVPAADLGAIRQYRDQGSVHAQPTAGGTPSAGTLVFVDNAVDTTTGTIMLKGSFPNQDGTLWPGEFVNVSLQLYVQPEALTVPSTAVMNGQQGSYVFVVKSDSTADARPVTVQRTSGDLTIIDGDLADGDQVVTDGQLLLRSGSRVQIKRASAAPAEAS